MATFSSWWVSIQKDPKPKQVTWLCGPERILVEEIVQQTRERLNAAIWNLTSLTVGEDSERAIWAEVNQQPVGSGNRLVIIRDAEKLKSPERLTDFVRHRIENRNTYLVFVSAEDRIRKTVVGDKGETELVDFLAILAGGKGHVIECKPFTQATAKHARMWVQSKLSIRDNVAGYLLDRANGDLRLVRDMCVKLAQFPNDVNMTTINELLRERPRDTFSDALLALDRKTALLALESLPEADYSRMVGFLDMRLDLAGLVHDMLLEHKSVTEIARAAGRFSFLVPEVMKVSRHYDKARRLSIRKLLTVADEALRGGVSTGVLESIIIGW